ncbi:MAG: bifunctional demethylmenaquinone methyltransferase/2-methoxy-6-polyprenyl-1,4-benzoquinol methylase [Bacteroidetes bacterium GWE2_29_8]|nr:MAG: bifunctional demethylmenaquinone methyltransferase/2-methoxy-6-polyprenyl-1,4-benzoquinol methylase [Bacteroidetes bacterium GWE2_29_8]OFY19150.1 MAG: bifunctional demethylmenaquinone methyltransferase/2-methoxy-6-polyprenyl-1,4-benzoquinol methylase [Bacteroidetes bacterium GWF2_29_10]
MTYRKTKSDISAMFDNIAHSYDLLNHLLSFNIDKRWRKRTVLELSKYKHDNVLDIATGTGDLAIEVYNKLKPNGIVGIDISAKMLDVAILKVKQLKLSENIKFQQADSLNIPFEADVFDAITIGFGIRNFEDINKALQEIKRVLNKEYGTVFILEFSKPQNLIVKYLYNLYSGIIMPYLGKLFSGDYKAYKYLNKSSLNFPSGKDFVAILLKNGYKNIRYIPLTMGVATIYIAQK